MNPLKEKRRALHLDNQKYGPFLVEIMRRDWPILATGLASQPTRVWRSRHFCVQFWPENKIGIVGRLSVMRCELDARGGWRDGITWDELQRLKKEAGFGDTWAIEVYPKDSAVVNVANFRHLWLLYEAPAFAWEKGA